MDSKNDDTGLFCADDKFSDIIDELHRRGWKKVPPSMPFCDLRWRNYSNTPFKRSRPGQYLNHIQNAHHLSNKGLLCLHLQQYEKGLADSVDRFYPQTWFLRHHGLHPFLRDFAICYSIATVKKQYGLCSNGSDFKIAGFDQCISYLDAMLHQDICHTECSFTFEDADREILLLHFEEEKNGHKNQCKEKNGLCAEDRRHILDLMSSIKGNQSAKLRNLVKLTHCTNAWVVKPAAASCGRGILCSSSLTEILQKAEDFDWNCVVQKYVEKPFLVQNYKFDVRLWTLVTSVEPLVIWGFSEFYLRFASKPFNVEDMADRFVHLCNNSIQKDSDCFNEGLCEGNMWSMQEFQDHIDAIHGANTFQTHLLRKFHQVVVRTLLSTRHVLEKKEHGFEWLGFDIMVGEDMSLHLLEVNLSPDVSHSTAITSRLVPNASKDLLTLVLDEGVVHKSMDIIRTALLLNPSRLHPILSSAFTQNSEFSIKSVDEEEAELKWQLWFAEEDQLLRIGHKDSSKESTVATIEQRKNTMDDMTQQCSEQVHDLLSQRICF
mmetsp:Transcript_28801/g.37837  ORF Transcript_28801/g.37837 Transcript_28801/m.37837 type:complete len:547 (+) Transcript_28801:157-1797(+)